MAKTNNTETRVDFAHRFCVRGGAPDSDWGLGGGGGAPNSDWGLGGVHRILTGPRPRKHPPLPGTSERSLSVLKRFPNGFTNTVGIN